MSCAPFHTFHSAIFTPHCTRALHPSTFTLESKVLGIRVAFSPSINLSLKSAHSRSSVLSMASSTVHDFTVKDIEGKDVSLSQYAGKVALIVNVASACGLTHSNYTELTELYDKYKDKGFVVLAFPSNQFGAQEPGSNDQIKDFACSRYKASFPLFSKIDVNGANADPLYKFLKSQKGGGLLGSEIKWNFGKFLVDKDGKVVERYAPTTSPAAIEKDIVRLLAN